MKFAHVARTDEVRVLLMTIFFNILVCNALFFPSRAQISRNLAKLTYKSSKYRVCLFLRLDPGGLHCVTFAATPIIAQQCFIHFLESLSDLDVHPGKRFALLGHYRRN